MTSTSIENSDPVRLKWSIEFDPENMRVGKTYHLLHGVQVTRISGNDVSIVYPKSME